MARIITAPGEHTAGDALGHGSAADHRAGAPCLEPVGCLPCYALWQVYVTSAAAHFMGDWGLAPEREAEMRVKAEAFRREATGILAGVA